MVDKEKVVIMTKEAMEEKRNQRKVFPARNFYMDDYLSFQVLKGAFGVTVLYVLGAVAWLFLTMDSWINEYSLEQLFGMVMRLGILYLCVLLAAVIVLILVYSLRYLHADRIYKDQQHNLKKLQKFYESEDKKWGE